MKKKQTEKSNILSDKEVQILSQVLQESIGDKISKKAKELGINFEDVIRFSSLSKKIQEKRESLGLTIKEVSKQLKVPQYKLKDIESNRTRNFNFKTLKDYIEYLKLDDLFKEWLEANPQFKFK